MNVWVGSLDGDAFKPVTADRDRGVRFFAWARDNRHLLYIQDRGGDENWHLYRVDPTSSRTLDLTPFEGVQARSEGMSKHVPGVVLVGLNRRTTERHDLYRLDLSSGDLTLLEENPGYLGWTADLRLRPRAALRMGDDESSQILVREQDRDGFRVIYEVGPEDGMGLRPLGFEAGGRHLFLHRRVGNPEKDADFLWSRSPLSRADQIRVPLLIAQGSNDPRVKQAESEQIVAALDAKGIPYQYLLFPDEGHGFAKPQNRLRFHAAAERFLARHLGGRFEPVT